MIRTQRLANVPEWKVRRAGFISEGNPTSLHVVRSMRVGLARRIAMGGDPRRELKEAEQQPAPVGAGVPEEEREKQREGGQNRPRRLRGLPSLAPFPLRPRTRTRDPKPT